MDNALQGKGWLWLILQALIVAGGQIGIDMVVNGFSRNTDALADLYISFGSIFIPMAALAYIYAILGRRLGYRPYQVASIITGSYFLIYICLAIFIFISLGISGYVVDPSGIFMNFIFTLPFIWPLAYYRASKPQVLVAMALPVNQSSVQVPIGGIRLGVTQNNKVIRVTLGMLGLVFIPLYLIVGGMMAGMGSTNMNEFRLAIMVVIMLSLVSLVGAIGSFMGKKWGYAVVVFMIIWQFIFPVFSQLFNYLRIIAG
jgi:hypothetical protein